MVEEDVLAGHRGVDGGEGQCQGLRSSIALSCAATTLSAAISTARRSISARLRSAAVIPMDESGSAQGAHGVVCGDSGSRSNAARRRFRFD